MSLLSNKKVNFITAVGVEADNLITPSYSVPEYNLLSAS